MLATIVLAALVAVSAADRRPTYHQPQPSYKQPSYQPSYHQPSYKEPEYNQPAYYQYGYDVQDDYSGVDFSANEHRDGYNTEGQYQVALPDGRTQTVTYTVDGYSGFVADVDYYGEAQYPQYHAQPAYNSYKPQPAYNSYKPQPSYRPQPSYHQ